MTHPVFGELKWDSSRLSWTVRPFVSSGKKFTVIIKPGRNTEPFEFLETSSRLFATLLDNEATIIREAINTKILALYNETWRQDEIKLSAEVLCTRMRLSLVEFGAVFPVTLWYQAGALFGGHDVAVLLDTDLKYEGIDLRG